MLCATNGARLLAWFTYVVLSNECCAGCGPVCGGCGINEGNVELCAYYLYISNFEAGVNGFHSDKWERQLSLLFRV